MSNASQSTDTAGRPVRKVVYSERLWIPLWWWLIGAAVAALIGYELHLAFTSVPAWVLMVALQPISIAVGAWLSRSLLTVTDDPAAADGTGREFHIAGRAHLPLSAAARAMAVPRSAKRAAMGRQLDPAAFVFQRPWVGPLALIVLDDPDDPTPYWLVSSRRPRRLLDALGAPQTSIQGDPAHASPAEKGAGAAE
ncbi:DUF3093 domain-containing protein [Tomitella fengzijianii]|uniref:DUF3093 domain-containing protein n=1 Tax=Tomitella fengzijianii TaxID=2597660 RepID=UPI001E50A4E6|nr:DUF3093 domain-containing protein [Tomitella fengzijianii]